MFGMRHGIRPVWKPHYEYRVAGMIDVSLNHKLQPVPEELPKLQVIPQPGIGTGSGTRATLEKVFPRPAASLHEDVRRVHGHGALASFQKRRQHSHEPHFALPACVSTAVPALKLASARNVPEPDLATVNPAHLVKSAMGIIEGGERPLEQIGSASSFEIVREQLSKRFAREGFWASNTIHAAKKALVTGLMGG